MYYIPQITPYDCGFACLKIILATLNKEKGYLFLKQDEEHKQYSLAEISSIAKDNGLSLIPFKVENKKELLKNKKYPLMIFLNYPGGSKHAVILTKIGLFGAHIIDPDKGTYTMNKRKLLSLWDGVAFQIDKYESRKSKISVKTTYSLLDKIYNLICQGCAVASVLLGFYYINENSQMIRPIICFTLFACFEVLSKLYTFRNMKKMDNTFYSDKVNISCDYKTYYERYENYKKSSYLNPFNFITMLVFTLFLSIITIVNDLTNTFIVLIPLVLCCFDYFVVKPIFDDKNRDIELKESEVSKVTNRSDFYSLVNEIHKDSYSLTKFNIIKKVIYLALMITSSIVVMFLTKSILLPYAVFYFTIQFTLFENLMNMVTYPDKNREHLKAKALFFNAIQITSH